jgi:hypothetical protein
LSKYNEVATENIALDRPARTLETVNDIVIVKRLVRKGWLDRTVKKVWDF